MHVPCNFSCSLHVYIIKKLYNQLISLCIMTFNIIESKNIIKESIKK